VEINKEFTDMIGRTASSEAYLNYCTELYGYRMSLFNMMDKPQLDFLFDSIPIAGNDSILDLGCGNGSILKHLMKKYGCSGVGVDQLEPGIVERQNGSIPYISGNIDELESYSLDPSITISVDSLYFSNDLNRLLNTLNRIKSNRLYLYYSQYIFDEKQEDNNILKYNNTRLAKSLDQAGISYRILDYSENERKLYERAIQILPEYKDAFKREGIGDIFEKKNNENIFGKELYDNDRASRFLYIIDDRYGVQRAAQIKSNIND
jgi:SAM-dependent methyltransferase